MCRDQGPPFHQKEFFAGVHFFGISKEMNFLRTHQGNEVSCFPEDSPALLYDICLMSTHAEKTGLIGICALSWPLVLTMFLQGIFMLIRFRRGRWQDIDFAGQPLM